LRRFNKSTGNQQWSAQFWLLSELSISSTEYDLEGFPRLPDLTLIQTTMVLAATMKKGEGTSVFPAAIPSRIT
jgi:hypothetical protein